MPFSNAVREIETQTDYLFIYNSSLVDASRKVKVGEISHTVRNIIHILEPQVGHNFKVRGKYIIVDSSRPYSVPVTLPETANRTSDVYMPRNIHEIGTTVRDRRFQKEEPVLYELSSTERLESAPTQSVEPDHINYTPIQNYSVYAGKLPRVAVKLNFLYTSTTFTPNAGLEYGFSDRQTAEVGFSHNRWKYKASHDNNDKLLHWIVRAEYKYWFCERYNGHFIGGYGLYGRYNIRGKSIPTLFKKKYRYEGYAVGGGVSYGYHLQLARKWGIEFELGLGAAYLKYDKYDCRLCDRNARHGNKIYFGPTRAGISMVFLLK